MRIIAGKLKGKRLIAPKKLPVRPTTDMAKESLFNIIQNHFDFHELTILDLFSGTGNISYEMASRGVEMITAVDQNIHCIQYINATKKNLQIDNAIQALKADVFNFLKKCNTTYDIVFADPPYDFELDKYQTIINLVLANDIISDEGILIIEHSTQIDLSQEKNYWMGKKYGSVCFSFFQHNNPHIHE